MDIEKLKYEAKNNRQEIPEKYFNIFKRKQ